MLCFDITFRYQKGDCLIYTFTLENSVIRPAAFKDDDCYFQVGFSLSSKLGFCPLPDTQRVNVNDEDYLSNQLLYRDVRNYAIGHGCAANWEETADKVVFGFVLTGKAGRIAANNLGPFHAAEFALPVLDLDRGNISQVEGAFRPHFLRRSGFP